MFRYRKIASDKCVQGKDTFFLPVVKDCPVQAPGDIDLRTTNNVQTVLVGDTVTFQFTQGQVMKAGLVGGVIKLGWS